MNHPNKSEMSFLKFWVVQELAILLTDMKIAEFVKYITHIASWLNKQNAQNRTGGDCQVYMAHIASWLNNQYAQNKIAGIWK